MGARSICGYIPRGVAGPIIGIVGPTASGKTDLAMALAETWPVEILVADSRQVYRGMDIGTAKPDATARAAVPHHLLDLVEPDEAFTVAVWVNRARALLPQILDRGRIPMLVGGTGLYVSALLNGHDYAAQPRSADARRRLTDELETEGLKPLATRLAELSPAAAAITDLRNPRRVVNALERAERGGGGVVVTSRPYGGRVALIGVSWPREVLYRRIDERAARLFATGLLDEVRTLLDAGHDPDRRPLSSHGYGEAARHLAGEWSLEQAIAVTARRTRQYAKRQLTWFRRDPRIVWVAGEGDPSMQPERAAQADAVLRAALS